MHVKHPKEPGSSKTEAYESGVFSRLCVPRLVDLDRLRNAECAL